MTLQTQKAQLTPSKINIETHTKTHYNLTLEDKNKERIWKESREKQFATYKGSSIRLTAYLSSETMESRKLKDIIFKVLKEKKKNSISNKVYFKNEQEIKTFQINKS